MCYRPDRYAAKRILGLCVRCPERAATNRAMCRACARAVAKRNRDSAIRRRRIVAAAAAALAEPAHTDDDGPRTERIPNLDYLEREGDECPA